MDIEQDYFSLCMCNLYLDWWNQAHDTVDSPSEIMIENLISVYGLVHMYTGVYFSYNNLLSSWKHKHVMKRCQDHAKPTGGNISPHS